MLTAPESTANRRERIDDGEKIMKEGKATMKTTLTHRTHKEQSKEGGLKELKKKEEKEGKEKR